MFTNRGYGWKLGAALAVTAGLGVYAYKRGEGINPALWRCVAHPERWRDAALWVPRAVVVSVADDGFEIESAYVKLPVRGGAKVTVGQTVSMTATFHTAGGPHLRLKEVRAYPPHVGLRWLAEVVSLAVFALILFNFLRHFAFRPQALRVEGRSR